MALIVRPATTAAAMLILSSAACARAPFERYIKHEQWPEAATAFVSDSSLLDREHALFEAGKLYGSPERGVFDPGRARDVFDRLLTRFPETHYRQEATDRLSLVNAMLRQRDSVERRTTALLEEIAQLTADTRRLRTSLDSAIARGDSLQHAARMMEADLHDRDDQLRALRLELERLKEIDLKPRPPVP